MSKLFIDNNGINVQVAEIGMISAKEQTILGNGDRDLILRTQGNVKIQVGNKFYNLLNENVSSNSNTNESVIFLTNDSDLVTLTLPDDGTFIFISESKNLYIVLGGVYQLISTSSDESIKTEGFISYKELQKLSGTEKQIASYNTGLVIDNINNVSNLTTEHIYPNMIVYSLSDKKHYILDDSTTPFNIDSWSEAYLSLQGGTMKGPIILDKPLTINDKINFLNASIFDSDNNLVFRTIEDLDGFEFRNSKDISNLLILEDKISLFGYPSQAHDLTINGTTLFKTITTFGSDLNSIDFSKGTSGFSLDNNTNNEWTLEIDNLIVRNESKKNIFETKSLNGDLIADFNIQFLTTELIETIPVYNKALTSGKYKDDGLIKVEIDFNTRPKYLEILRTPLSELENLLDSESTPPIKVLDTINLGYGIGYKIDNTTESTLITYNKDENDNYTLIEGEYDYDSLNNEYVESLNGEYVQLFDIRVYEITTDSELTVGDLLIYKKWDEDKEEITTTYVEVVYQTLDSYYIYNYSEPLTENIIFSKIGNKTINTNLLKLDSANEKSIGLYTDIKEFNSVIKNFYYDSETEETISVDYDNGKSIVIHQDNVNTKIGLLNINDNELNLFGIDTYGLYSTSAYLKGNLVSYKHIMGDQLLFENNILTIVDLETIKSRTITSSNGLNGGGNLFDSNLIIKHNNKTWVDKTTLTNGEVISNLTIDDYGHITDWETRQLTLDWTAIDNTPTTISGYGITDINKNTIGLPNVDNTSDLNKPISNDTQDALDLKLNILDLPSITNKAELDGSNINQTDFRIALGLGDNAYTSTEFLPLTGGIVDGTLEITQDLILKSPNGTKYKLTVDNSGVLNVSPV